MRFDSLIENGFAVIGALALFWVIGNVVFNGVPAMEGDTGGPERSPTTTATATPTKTNTPKTGEIDTTRAERLVFEYVNDHRSERGMGRLSYNERAAAAARAHASDMAANDYFSHTSLDGETQQERYSFCDGGENAAQTWVYRRVEQSDGDIVYISTTDELARSIVEGWMNSDPHRERGIFGEYWTSAGVGIAIADDNKAYAVMGFCST